METLRIFEENVDGIDYFVGDLHGSKDLLMAKLEQLDFNFDDDRLFSVGDLIDRGRDSMGTLQLLNESWFFAVCGNHEILMLDSLLSGDFVLWGRNGGGWFNEYSLEELQSAAELIKAKMSLALQVPCMDHLIGVIHADVTSGVWGNFHDTDDLWSRTRLRYLSAVPVKGVDAVVVGHSILGEIETLGNVIHIDTGAYHSTGSLTILSEKQVLDLVSART